MDVTSTRGPRQFTQDAPFETLARDEKLALPINAYNASTLRLIVDHYPVASIRDIPEAERWDAVRWRIGRHTWSLKQIEHEQIRPTFAEPRIHVALVCAAVGCPPLRTEAYVAARLTIEQAKGDRALLDGETEGVLKIHARKDTDTILGATLVARHAGEMISEITLAMKAGVGLGTLAATIHPYPPKPTSASTKPRE